MAYRRPVNPAKFAQSKFRQFDGIGGPRIQLLRRFNERGWDVSNTICNEIQDLNLNQGGSMFLRDGFRKINATGESATITNIFAVSVGKVPAYGVVVDGALDIITLPAVNVSVNPVDLSPANSASAVATLYPDPDPSISYP